MSRAVDVWAQTQVDCIQLKVALGSGSVVTNEFYYLVYDYCALITFSSMWASELCSFASIPS